MTVVTKLPYDKDYIEKFSIDRNEPDWMKALRLQAFEQVDALELPKPDKTNINRWNFSSFKHGAEGEVISSIQNLPTELQEHFDLDNIPKNIIIQRNQTNAYATIDDELKDKGVIFTDILTACKEHGELVQKYYMEDAVSIDEHRLTALHGALMNGGVFV